MPRRDIQWGGEVEEAVASAARTASADTGIRYGFGPAKTIRAQLDVTAASGTSPTLDVVIEDSLDGTNYNAIGTFAQKTAVGREVINITTPFSDALRVRWTVGGVSPSFTFGVRWAIEG